MLLNRRIGSHDVTSSTDRSRSTGRAEHPQRVHQLRPILPTDGEVTAQPSLVWLGLPVADRPVAELDGASASGFSGCVLYSAAVAPATAAHPFAPDYD